MAGVWAPTCHARVKKKRQFCLLLPMSMKHGELSTHQVLKMGNEQEITTKHSGKMYRVLGIWHQRTWRLSHQKCGWTKKKHGELHCSSTGNLAWQMTIQTIHIFNVKIMETYTSSKLKNPWVSLTVVASFPSCRFVSIWVTCPLQPIPMC